MELMEAIKTYRKMCDKSRCEDCWFRRFHIGIRGEVCSKRDRTVMSCDEIAMKFPNVLAAAVKRWSEEHPRRTMLDELFDTPTTTGASLCPDGSVRLCPHHLDPAYGGLCQDGKGSAALCRSCWNREVEG